MVGPGFWESGFQGLGFRGSGFRGLGVLDEKFQVEGCWDWGRAWIGLTYFAEKLS